MMSDFSSVEPHLLAVARYLRSEPTIKLFDGIMADRRVYVFKGVQAVSALTTDKFFKKMRSIQLPNDHWLHSDNRSTSGQMGDSRPAPLTREEAEALLMELLDAGFFVRGVRVEQTRHLQPTPSKSFVSDALYAWMFEGSQLQTILGALLLLACLFAFVMYPLWPRSLKKLSYYAFLLAVAFIAFILLLGVIRIIVYAVTRLTHPPGGWLFPNLFADVGFVESFIPIWEWEKAPSKKDD